MKLSKLEKIAADVRAEADVPGVVMILLHSGKAAELVIVCDKETEAKLAGNLRKIADQIEAALKHECPSAVHVASGRLVIGPEGQLEIEA